MKQRKFLIMLMTLMLPISMWATGYALAVELNNGETKYFFLSDKPVLTYSGSKLIIENRIMTVATNYERSDIKKLHFVDETVGIEEVEEKENTVIFAQKDEDILEISNLPEKERIVVSNLAGRLYSDCVSKNGTVATVDLSSCPKGVYIIKVGNQQTIKMTKK